QLDGRERLALPQRGGVGEPHGRVGQVAVDAAVQRAHRVVVPLVRLQLEDGMARLAGLQDETDQAADPGRGYRNHAWLLSLGLTDPTLSRFILPAEKPPWRELPTRDRTIRKRLLSSRMNRRFS